MIKLLPQHIKIILGLVVGWRLILTLTSLFIDKWLPFATLDRYLGGGSKLHFTGPELFGWANFDGEHYLSIAIFGYRSLEQAFFPLFPGLLSIASNLAGGSFFNQFFSATIWGLFLTHISLVLGLILVWEIIKYQSRDSKLAYLTIILILVFPTAFFWGALYTESIFLLFSAASFYFYQRARDDELASSAYQRQRYWFAGIMGFFASLTRIYGIVLALALLLDWLIHSRKLSKLIPLGLIPLGLIIYMIYLWQSVGDPLAFYNLQTLVGPQHQAGVILPPQVYYRYLKMFSSFTEFSWMIPTLILEFFVGLLFLALPIWGWLKTKIPTYFLFYSLIGFLMPSIQGSFSSVPRYVLVLFPSFWVLAIILLKCSVWLKWSIITVSAVLMLSAASLFLKGYWIG